MYQQVELNYYYNLSSLNFTLSPFPLTPLFDHTTTRVHCTPGPGGHTKVYCSVAPDNWQSWSGKTSCCCWTVPQPPRFRRLIYRWACRLWWIPPHQLWRFITSQWYWWWHLLFFFTLPNSIPPPASLRTKTSILKKPHIGPSTTPTRF